MSSEINIKIQPLHTSKNDFKLASEQNAKPKVAEMCQINNSNTSIFTAENNIARLSPIGKLDNPYVEGDNEKLDEVFRSLSSNGSGEYNIEIDAKNIGSTLKDVIYSDSSNRTSQLINIIENQVDPANIDLILEEYKTLTNGRNLKKDLDIVFENSPFKKRKMEKLFDEIQNFEKLNTSINNKYWKGDSHNIVRNGSTFTITNTETNETKEIDLSKLLADFDSSKERKKFIKTMQKLPAEVLMDMAAEQSELIELDGKTILDMGNGATCNAAGYYTSGSDQVALYDNSSIGTIVHEFGHALDYNKINGSNKSSVTNNEIYVEIFNEEMENFLADGHKRYDYDDAFALPWTYATANEREMFAECYTLLMTGNCNSKGVIEKYFPRMLGYVRQLVEYNRGHSDEIRH